MNQRLKSKIVEKYGSQSSFCRAIGVSDAVLSRLVQEWRLPTKDQKNLIASKLGCKPDEIFNDQS